MAPFFYVLMALMDRLEEFGANVSPFPPLQAIPLNQR